MAAIAVGACQRHALLNAGISRFHVSRYGNDVGRVSLVAWDPLLVRSGLFRVSSLNLRKDGKIKFSSPPWKASVRDEIENDSGSEKNAEAEKGFLVKLSENLKDSISSAAKPALAVFLTGLLLFQPLDDAWAASSAGRMGGRVFKSAPPPSRSYSGGGGGGGGRVYSAPPIYGSPYGYGAPFGFSPFTPFFGGGYYGGGGIVLGSPIGFGGGGFFLFAMIAYVTFRAIAGFFRDRFGDRDDFDD